MNGPTYQGNGGIDLLISESSWPTRSSAVRMSRALQKIARRHAYFFRHRPGRVIHGAQQSPAAEEMARHGREIDNARASRVCV